MLPELDDDEDEEEEEDELLELDEELEELDDDEELVACAPLELDEPLFPAPPQPTNNPNNNKDVVNLRTPGNAVPFVLAPSEDK